MTKRILSALLTAVLLLSFVFASAVVTHASEKYGDTDGDGTVTILDATQIQRSLASLIHLDKDAIRRAMVCNNPTLTILDATYIQRYLADLIDRFPAGDVIETQSPTNPSQQPTEPLALYYIRVSDDGISKAVSDCDMIITGADYVTLTATPASGYAFKQWQISGKYTIISGSLTDEVLVIDPRSDINARAQFEKLPDEVTKVKNNITVYFSNNKNWATVNAYIYNNATGTPMAKWPGKAMTYVKTNDMGEKVYSVTADAAKYDRIIFNNGTDQTTDTPLTKASSGYFLNSKKSAAYHSKFLAGLYPYGQDGEGKVTTVNMDYPDGYKKKVYIWTPEGYNANDKSKKYSVLYMCDGQNLFGQMTTLSGFEWECDESVLSLMHNGGDGVIVVGVDNSTNKRNHELTPDLGTLSSLGSGDPSYKNGGGKVYSDFVVDTVIPYVEKNYNVNSIRGIAGSSSGGIEAFYIGMEHMDKFRYIGALSPAFILFDKPVWDKYLDSKDLSGDLPRIYFFNGNSDQDPLEQALYNNAVAMEGWMKNHGYPAEKMITVTDDDATHSEGFWALYFPEMLSFGLGV